MVEPWFSPYWAWLPGTLLGTTAGIFGGLAGWLGPRGKAKGLVLGGMWTLLVISLLLVIAGAVALIAGQPYAIWYGLGLAGLLGSVVLGLNAPAITRVYRLAEMRRIEAKDLG